MNGGGVTDDRSRNGGGGLLFSLAFVPLLIILDEYFIYLVMRHVGRANRSEAALGVGLFLAVSLVLLTIVGIYFRGENMALAEVGGASLLRVTGRLAL